MNGMILFQGMRNYVIALWKRIYQRPRKFFQVFKNQPTVLRFIQIPRKAKIVVRQKYRFETKCVKIDDNKAYILFKRLFNKKVFLL